MNNQKIFDPIPDFKSGEKIFECCTKGLYNESKEGYEFFEQLAKKLFEHFKYQYEVLSPVVLPENEDDIHIYQYIKKAAEKEIINLDGTKYIVPESGCIFNEKRHVHFTRFHAFGGINTPFPLGKSMANHHLTLEDYVLSLKYPLFKFAYNEEIIPYVFPTDHNYFLESANNCFMDDNKYDVKPNPIIYHSMHKEIYTPKYFNDKLNVSPILLSFKTNISTKFVKILSRGKNVKYNRTINFALQLLYSSILILSGFVDIFGSSRNRSEMLLNLNENWTYPNGRKIKGINIYHLNILSFLYLTFHPTATVLGYGLYRNKYGVNSKSAHRTAFYLTDDKIVIALKDYVSKVVKEKINEYSLDLKYIEDNELINDYKDYIKEIILLIKALLIIASYYGTGYKTEKRG